MKQFRFLIIVPYFNRPNMFREVVKSFSKIEYSNWHCAVIDDGSDSDKKALPILQEILPDDRYTLYDTKDSVQNKRDRGHSLHATFMNKALKEVSADYAIIISDDDGIHHRYLSDLNEYYNDNPECPYSYCHVIPYDPVTELPAPETFEKRREEVINEGQWRNFDSDSWIRLNHTQVVAPVNALDSTQVSWNIAMADKHQCYFKENVTANNDRDIYSKFSQAFGGCPFNGTVGPYKGFHSNQLGCRIRQHQDIFEVLDK